MTDTTDIDAILAKLSKALQQIEAKLQQRPGDPALEIAKASIESAVEDLLGRRAH